MFWIRIRLRGREYLGVLDTGATMSIVAKKILPCGSLKNTMTTAAIRMGDKHVVHSCGDCEVEVPMGSRTIAHRFYVMDTEAFDFVLGTDFFVQHSQIQSLTLQAPYFLYVYHGEGRESVLLEQSEHTSSYLRLSTEDPSNMMAASKTEDYQLLGEVLGGFIFQTKGYFWSFWVQNLFSWFFRAYTILYRYTGVQHCSAAPPQSRQKYSKIGPIPRFLMVWEKARVGGNPPIPILGPGNSKKIGISVENPL